MEELAVKSKRILVTTWATIILGFVFIAAGVLLLVFLPELGELSEGPAIPVCSWILIVGFGVLNVYYIILLIGYCRAPKTILSKEGEQLVLFDAKRGMTKVALKDLTYVGISGTFMKASMVQMMAKKADGDLILRTNGGEYKVRNVGKADEVRQKLLSLAEEAKIKASLARSND